MTDPNPYEILGIDKNADEATIRAAYRAAARKAHPDKEGGSNELMVRLNVAMEILSDPSRKARFDETGDTSKPGSIEAEVQGLLISLIDGLLMKSPPPSNFLAAVKKELERTLAGVSSTKEAAIKDKKKFEKFLSQHKRKNGSGLDLFQMAGRAKLEQVSQAIEECGKAALVIEKAMELCSDYEFTGPEEEGQAFVIIRQSAFSPGDIFGSHSTWER